MGHLATSIAISLALARERSAADHRQADAWRRLHARPDALPDAVKPATAARRRRFAALASRLPRQTPMRG